MFTLCIRFVFNGNLKIVYLMLLARLVGESLGKGLRLEIVMVI